MYVRGVIWLWTIFSLANNKKKKKDEGGIEKMKINSLPVLLSSQ